MVKALSDKPGKKLERLIAMLESALAQTGAVIESPSRRLIDNETGRRREHDVLITWEHGHHTIITAIECRDRSRPVGVPEVEAFADKCRCTGVNSGVIVSTQGFSQSARDKAAKRSITCMEIEEVERFDWLGTEAVVRFERKFDHIDAKIMFEATQPASLAAVFDTDGAEVSEAQIMQLVVNAVPNAESPEDEVGKVFPVNLQINTVNWTARDLAGTLWPISHIVAKTSFTMTRTSHDFSTHRYKGGGKEYSIASADAVLGEQKGKFLLVQGEDGETSVMWAPDKHGHRPAT